MRINDNSTAQEDRPNKSSFTKKSRKLQLWMNQSKTKYAIGFKKRWKFPFTSMTSYEDGSKIKNTLNAMTGSKSSFYATTMDGKKYSVRLNPYVNCCLKPITRERRMKENGIRNK